MKTGVGFSARRQLRDQLATLMVAGHETTGVTLFWSLYLLAQLPAAQDRIAAEATVGSDLSFTRAFVSERFASTRRRLPSRGSARARPGRRDSEIPKGMVLPIATWALHRHRKFWRDPYAFDPCRFHARRPAAAALCIPAVRGGTARLRRAQFALAEATLALVRLAASLSGSNCSTRRRRSSTAIITTATKPPPDVPPDFART